MIIQLQLLLTYQMILDFGFFHIKYPLFFQFLINMFCITVNLSISFYLYLERQNLSLTYHYQKKHRVHWKICYACCKYMIYLRQKAKHLYIILWRNYFNLNYHFISSNPLLIKLAFLEEFAKITYLNLLNLLELCFFIFKDLPNFKHHFIQLRVYSFDDENFKQVI